MAKKSTPLAWETVKKTINELNLLEINPRKITDEKRAALQRSLEKFNLVEIPTINIDDTVISGNQRLAIMKALGRGEEIIEVRIPNRKLTEQELKEYVLIANTHAGTFDVDMLDAEFADVTIEFEVPFVDEVEKPSNKVHLLNNENLEEELYGFKGGLRKALQIEFEMEDYETAANLVKACREKDLYIGKLLIEKLTEVKEQNS